MSMKINTSIRKLLIGGVGLATALILTLAAACSSGSSSTTSAQALDNGTPPASGLAGNGPGQAGDNSGATPGSGNNSGQPGDTSGAGAGNPGAMGQGTSGTVTAVSGDTLTLTTSDNNTVQVTFDSSTNIEKTVSLTASDLQTGETLMVTGQADSSGVVQATAIRVSDSAQAQGTGLPSNGGEMPSPTGSPIMPTGTDQPLSSGQAGMGGQNQGTFGTLASINGSTLTLTDMQGQSVQVAIGTDTTITKTTSGSSSDLQSGIKAMVMGSTDTSGAVTAKSIIITQ